MSDRDFISGCWLALATACVWLAFAWVHSRRRRVEPPTFPAFCKLGHRIIPSTGACYDVREILPPSLGDVRVFGYFYLDDCEGRR